MRHRVAAAIVVWGLVAAACGSSSVLDSETVPVANTIEMAPIEVVPIERADPPEEVNCPNFVAEGEDRSPRHSFVEHRLHDDAETLTNYGFAHPEAFGGLRFRHDPTRLEIEFKMDVEEHCLAIRELVKRKNGFDVVHAPYSFADKQVAAAAAAAIGAEAIVQSWGPTTINLPAFAEATAAALDMAYGDMFEIRVGGWPFPPPSDVSIEEACPPVVESDDPPPLQVTAIAPSGPVDIVSGGEVALVVENRGDKTGRVDWGQQVSSLFAEDSDNQPVSRYSGAIELWAATAELEPGDSIQMSAFIGLSPCSLDDGYMLLPGTYLARGPLLISWNDVDYVMLFDAAPIVVAEVASTSLTPKVSQSVTAPPTTEGG